MFGRLAKPFLVTLTQNVAWFKTGRVRVAADREPAPALVGDREVEQGSLGGGELVLMCG
jgi:hypothetical protein